MLCVPFEKTTDIIPGSSARDCSAGATSGKVERESYAFITESIAESPSARDDSARACERERRVMVEKGMYCTFQLK